MNYNTCMYNSKTVNAWNLKGLVQVSIQLQLNTAVVH